MLQGNPGQRFKDMDTLLSLVDGLACRPMAICDKTAGCLLPPTHWGVSLADIRTSIVAKTREWGIEQLRFEESGQNQLISTTAQTKSLIVKTLHELQPWFHGRCTRLEAERRIEVAGNKQGMFL